MTKTPPANGKFQMVRAGDLMLRVFTREGDGGHPPLVLCNGLGQSIEILFPLMEQFPGRSLIAFDAAGVGRSDIPDEAASIPDHAVMLRQVLVRLGVAQCDLLGISWGGALAQQLTYDNPDRVRRLVLAITSAGGLGSWWGSPIALSEILFPMRYMHKAYGNFIGPWMYGGEAILQPWLFTEYSSGAIRPSMKGYMAQVQAMCSWTSLPWLHELRVPTQIIGGALDALIPITNQMLLASQMPNARFAVYAAGHLLMYSRRDEVGELVRGFLDEA